MRPYNACDIVARCLEACAASDKLLAPSWTPPLVMCLEACVFWAVRLEACPAEALHDVTHLGQPPR